MTKDSVAGHPGHLTEEQSQILDQFKSVLVQDGTCDNENTFDNATLLRFLRARNFDLQKSRHMFNECEKFRKEIDIDKLAETYGSEFKERPQVVKYWQEYWHKVDRDGRPVNYQHIGKLDVDNLYKVTTQERLYNYIAYGADRSYRLYIPVCCGMEGRPLLALSIIDLKGFNITEFVKGRKFFSLTTKMLQDYFPESIGSILVINAPYLFSKIWSWIKPWLAEATAAKVNVLSGDAKEELLARIPPENLPHFLGGKCKCDEGCMMSNAGIWTDGPSRSFLQQNLSQEHLKHQTNGDSLKSNENSPIPDDFDPSTLVPDILEHGKKILNGHTDLGPWKPPKDLLKVQDSTAEM